MNAAMIAENVNGMIGIVMFVLGTAFGVMVTGNIAKRRRAREKKKLIAEARWTHEQICKEAYRREHAMPDIG